MILNFLRASGNKPDQSWFIAKLHKERLSAPPGVEELGNGKGWGNLPGSQVWVVIHQENPSFTFHAFSHFFALFHAFHKKSRKSYVVYLPECFPSCSKK